MIANFLSQLREHWEAIFSHVCGRLSALRFEAAGKVDDAVRLLQAARERPFARCFALGIPALTAFFLVGLVALGIATQSEAELVIRYKSQIATAIRSDNGPLLRVAGERLQVLDRSLPEGQFGLGILADKAGEFNRASDLIHALAPRDRPGYPAAHVWRARKLLSAARGDLAALQEAEAHLLHAQRGENEAHEARGLLAKVYLDTDRIDQAEPLIIEYATAWPEITLRMVRIQLTRDRHRQAGNLLARLAYSLQQRVQSSPTDSHSRLLLAETLALQGNFTDAVHVLQQGLAVDPDGPYHMPLATTCLEWADSLARTAAASPERTKLIRKAIGLFEKHGPQTAETYARLYRLHQCLGNAAEAERYLIRAADGIPALRVELARVYQQRGAIGKATELARHALDEFREQLTADPNNDLARLLAADAALVLGEHVRSVQLLEEGLRRKPQSQVFRAALAKVYAAWWDAESRQSSLATEERLDLLRRALRHDPWNIEVVYQLLLASRSANMGSPAESMLQDMLVKGDAPAFAHLLLGTHLLEENKLAAARKHLEMAYELEPRLVGAANNLAWALTRGNPPDLHGALQLINGAITRQPQLLSLRETRGSILVRLRQWSDAVIDLEQCLPTFQGKLELHRALAEAYAGLGQNELAE